LILASFNITIVAH